MVGDMRTSKVKVLIFCIISFVLTIILCFVPYDIIMMDDNIVMSQDEFSRLLQTKSAVVDREYEQCFTTEEENAIREYSIKYKLFNIFNIKNLKVSVVDNKVFVGGKALGFGVNTNGVIVVGSNYIITKTGKAYPMLDSGIQVGDMIVGMNDKDISCVQDILDILNGDNCVEGIKVKILHNGQEKDTTIYPAKDLQTNTYKLGLWLKEDAMGVGTLTYVDSDSNYGALGHAISLDGSGVPLDITGGNIYNCNIVGIRVGQKGEAGQLLGVFNTTDSAVGDIDRNNEYGVYGKVYNIAEYTADLNEIEIGGTATVKPGKAKILSCINGKQVKEYDIEIIKTNYQNNSEAKSMVIRVTDNELLKQTGGIVQGMSGSPIIQGGKLIGAVTHVFLNDSTKGFGLFIDWMI